MEKGIFDSLTFCSQQPFWKVRSLAALIEFEVLELIRVVGVVGPEATLT